MDAPEVEPHYRCPMDIQHIVNVTETCGICIYLAYSNCHQLEMVKTIKGAPLRLPGSLHHWQQCDTIFDATGWHGFIFNKKFYSLLNKSSTSRIL